METYQPSRVRRVLALLAILLNAGFGYIYPYLPLGLEDMKTASGHYSNFFTPAGYAFSIWGLIYLSWILYVIYSLLPSQRRNPLHDRLCGPLIVLNLLASAWIFEFTAGYIGISLFIIVGMLAVGVWVYARAKRGTRSGRLLFPFSLFLGWIIVATFANLTAMLTAAGWHGGSWGESAWTMFLLGVTALIGLIVGYRYRDFVIPLVIAWAVVAIGVKQRMVAHGVTFVAFAVGILMVVVAIVAFVRSLRPPRRV